MSNNNDVAATISSNNQKLCAELAAGNAAGVAAFYAKGAQLMPTNADFIAGDALASWWQGAIDMGVKDGSLTSISVEVHGDTAIEVGRYRLLGDDKVELDQGKYLVVWRKEGGDWKLYLDIFNTSQPAA